MTDHGFDLEALQAHGHSIFSPSGSAMWLYCSGSLLPNLVAPDDSGEDAAEGTVGHAVAEEWLNRMSVARKAHTFASLVTYYRPNDLIGEVRTIKQRTASFDIEITEEMLDYVQRYVQWCVDQPGEHYIETKVYFSEITPIDGQGGTADHAACSWQKLCITDLKYGRGVPVQAENNTQGLLYGLGFFYAYDWLYNFQEITIRIAQPRRESFTTWTITREQLLEFAEWAKVRAAAAWVPDAPRTPGVKTCTWCKVRAACPAWLLWLAQPQDDGDVFDDVSGSEIIEGEYTVKDMQLAEQQFLAGQLDVRPTRDPQAMSTAALAKLLPFRGMVEKFFNDVERELEVRAQNGEDLTPFNLKLVPGREGRRAWKKTEEAEEYLRLLGVGYSEIYNDVIVTPAVATDLVRKALGITKKSAAELLDSAVTRPPSRQTLVPITDQRPELIDPADDSFDDVSGL